MLTDGIPNPLLLWWICVPIPLVSLVGILWWYIKHDGQHFTWRN